MWHFLIILAIIAFFYSSVGHGGASGYLALFALYSLDTSMMKSSALLLNIFVSSMSFWQYYRQGYFRLNLFLIFAISSIPFAFLGGKIELNEIIYKKILAVCLILAILRILGIFGKKSTQKINPVNIPLAIVIGGIIGFFSGLIGIGGGIILSPVILLLRWGTVKITAGVSALFIFVNSVAGWIGNTQSGVTIYPEIYQFVLVALIGGILGSYYGSSKLNNQSLKYLLVGVLAFASLKLWFFA